jgi:CHAD domain-containing protein
MHKSTTTSYAEPMETSGATNLSVHLRHEVEVLHHRVAHAAAALATSVRPSAVHNTRVAARRLRVFLQAYRREFDSAAAKQFKRALVRLTHDLAAAREADVTRRAIAQLTRSPHTIVARQSRALRERAAREYNLSVSRLRLTVVAAPWQQRLIDLRRLSMLSSLVKESDALAVTVTNRLVKRRRQRLRDALRHAGKSPKRLHRIRLKVKALRYLLEDCLPRTVIARNAEVRRLRQLQDCLGELHDEENLLKALRAEPTRRHAAHVMCDGLEARKKQHLHEFKSHRKDLLQVWHRSVEVSAVSLRR